MNKSKIKKIYIAFYLLFCSQLSKIIKIILILNMINSNLMFSHLVWLYLRLPHLLGYPAATHSKIILSFSKHLKKYFSHLNKDTVMTYSGELGICLKLMKLHDLISINSPIKSIKEKEMFYPLISLITLIKIKLIYLKPHHQHHHPLLIITQSSAKLPNKIYLRHHHHLQ